MPDPADRPHLEEAIRYCRLRLAQAWSERERAVWSARLAENERHLAALDETRPPCRVENHGSIVLVRPLTDWCREWLEEHTDGQWWGGALAVEPRYVDALLEGLAEAYA